MKKYYDFSKGVQGKYVGKISKESSWVLDTQSCKFCGKMLYESLNDAEYVSEQKSINSQKFYIYECPYKIGWHLTTIQR